MFITDSSKFSRSSNAKVSFVDNPQLKSNQFSVLQTMMSDSNLIRQNFEGYHCEPDITVFECRSEGTLKLRLHSL